MDGDVELLKRIYDRFNARDIDGVLAVLADDVAWANGMDGGHVHGREAVREYWTRQWTMVSVQAIRDSVGSAAAPAARCRKFRRGSFILNLPLASHHSITSSARASSVGLQVTDGLTCQVNNSPKAISSQSEYANLRVRLTVLYREAETG